VLLTACNLKCAYCRCPEIKSRVLGTEKWHAILRGLAELGTERIKFQGGEPTLRGDFRAIAAEAKRLGLRTAVVTNGVRVAEEPGLLEPIDEVVVSIDAVTPELHEAHRGPGTHAPAVAALEAARAMGRAVFVVMVVSRGNVGEVEAMLDFCEARGVRLNPQPVAFGRQYYDERARAIALDDAGIRALYRRLAEWRRAGRALVFSTRAYEYGASWRDYDVLTVRGKFPSSCMAGRFYVNIEPNGDVHPCQSCGAEFRPKNAVDDGLREALRHARRHDCVDCYGSYLVERRLLYGLDPSAVWAELTRS
jgi:MoaA/NifB/PqqE/SkfB family radical SAM enzyme